MPKPGGGALLGILGGQCYFLGENEDIKQNPSKSINHKIQFLAISQAYNIMNNLAKFCNPCLSLLSVTTDDKNQVFSTGFIPRKQPDSSSSLVRNFSVLNSLTVFVDLNFFYKGLKVF